MKKICNTIIIGLFCLYRPVHADINSLAEEIFNDAQQVYPKYFPSIQKTQLFAEWYYRYYPNVETYLGFNKNDKGIYVVGGIFGNEVFYVADAEEINMMLKMIKKSFGYYCDNNPNGLMCKQNGYEVQFSTAGQCIIQEINEQRSETGINLLSQMDNPVVEISGVKSSLARFDSLTDSLNQEFAIAFGSHCSIHYQSSNLPGDISNYRVNMDICFDITSYPVIEKFVLDPRFEVATQVTVSIKGEQKQTLVSDCFATNAKNINNLVTNESWVNKDGFFVKIE